MRIGIIGAGGISDTHVRAAREIGGVEIVAVHGHNPGKTAALAAAAGAVACDTLEALLALPMDMVAIGSPSGLHAAQAIAAVRRGLHVLVEKPLDVTTRKIDELLAEAERVGVRVGVMFQERLAPEMVDLKATIEAGTLGRPLLISGFMKWYRPPEYYAASKWRGTSDLDGGGVLMNQGIHTVDLLIYLFGPVARVTGRVATRLQHPRGGHGGAARVRERRVRRDPGVHRRVSACRAASKSRERRAPSSTRNRRGPRPWLTRRRTAAYSSFISAVKSGRAPVCDGVEGRRSVAVIEAIYRSSKSGGSETP